MIGKYLMAAVLAFSALAVRADDVYTFDSITAVEHRASEVVVTGVLVNTSTPTTVTVMKWTQGFIHDRCAALLNLVLSQPTELRYTLTTQTFTEYDIDDNPIQVTSLKRCGATPTP